MCAALFPCTFAIYWLIFISCCHAIRNLIFPNFEHMPESVVYYNESSSDNRLQIGCSMWPKWPLGYLTYHIAYIDHKQRQLSPVRSIFLCNNGNQTSNKQYMSDAKFLCLSDKSIISQLYNKQIHCIANTQFGSILSNPFSIVKVDNSSPLVKVPLSKNNQPNNVVLRLRKFILHNMGLIPCDLTINKSPMIYFTLNGTILQIDNTDKYRLIRMAIGSQFPTHLLIRDLQISDQGNYSCYMVNNYDQSNKAGPMIQIIDQLELDENPSITEDQILLNFLGLNSSNQLITTDSNLLAHENNSINLGQLPVIIVNEFEDLSLHCLIKSNSNKVAKIGRLIETNLTNPRYTYDPLFGVLTISRVRSTDGGVYFCSIGSYISYVQLQVKPESPLVTVYPQTVMQSFGGTVQLDCHFHVLVEKLAKNYQHFDSVANNNSLSIDRSLTVSWFLNGNITQSSKIPTVTTAQLFLPSLRPDDLGIYQCVVSNSFGLWESAFAAISQPSEHILHKVDYDIAFANLPNYPLVDNVTIYAKSGDTKLISCLKQMKSIHLNSLNPNEGTVSDLIELSAVGQIYQQLANILPGAGELVDRVYLLHMLGDAQLKWLKDDRILPLSNSSYSDFALDSSFSRSVAAAAVSDLNVTLVRSVDFGIYRCELFLKNNLLFKHSIQILPDTMMLKRPVIESALSQDLMKNDAYNNLGEVDVNDDSNSNDFFPHPTSFTNWLPDHTLESHMLVNGPRAQFRRHSWPIGTNKQTLLSPNDLALTDTKFDEHLRKPTVMAMGDNLAVLITWNSVNADFYRIQLRSSHAPNAAVWPNRLTITETVEECCEKKPDCCVPDKHFYLTGRQPGELEAGGIYQFRVLAVKQPDQIVDRSAWSDSISFLHISKIAPVITKTERLPDGSILVHWTLAASAVGFDVDHFLLLYRPEERLASGKITYDGFKAVFVDGGHIRKYKLHALEPGKGYQIVVYGVHTPPGLDPQANIFTGGLNGRLITGFSHEVFVKPSLIGPGGEFKLESNSNLMMTKLSDPNQSHLISFNSSESNRLMFVILGALVGLMMFIMICLMILCVWRQQRVKQHLLSHQQSYSQHPQSNTYGHFSNFFFGSNKNYRSKVKTKIPNGFMLNHLPHVVNSTDGSIIDQPNQRLKLSDKALTDSIMENEQNDDDDDDPNAIDDGVMNNGDNASCVQSEKSVFIHHQPSLPPSRSATLAVPVKRLTPCSGLTDNNHCYQFGQVVSTPKPCCRLQPHRHHYRDNSAQLSDISNLLYCEKSNNFNPNHHLMTRSNMIMMNELKREPPSGGSVHEDDTDDECAAIDRTVQISQYGQSAKSTRHHNAINHLHCSNPMFYQKSHLDNFYTMKPDYVTQHQQFNYYHHHHNPNLIDNQFQYFQANNAVTTNHNNHNSFVLCQSVPNYDPGFGTPPIETVQTPLLTPHLAMNQCNQLNGIQTFGYGQTNPQLMMMSDYMFNSAMPKLSSSSSIQHVRSNSCNFNQINQHPSYMMISNETGEIVPIPPPRKTHNYPYLLNPENHVRPNCQSLSHLGTNEDVNCAQNMRYYGLCQATHNQNLPTDNQIMCHSSNTDHPTQVSTPTPNMNSNKYLKESNSRSSRHYRRNKIPSRHNSCHNSGQTNHIDNMPIIMNPMMISSQIEFTNTNQNSLPTTNEQLMQQPQDQTIQPSQTSTTVPMQHIHDHHHHHHRHKTRKSAMRNCYEQGGVQS